MPTAPPLTWVETQPLTYVAHAETGRRYTATPYGDRVLLQVQQSARSGHPLGQTALPMPYTTLGVFVALDHAQAHAVRHDLGEVPTPEEWYVEERVEYRLERGIRLGGQMRWMPLDGCHSRSASATTSPEATVVADPAALAQADDGLAFHNGHCLAMDYRNNPHIRVLEVLVRDLVRVLDFTQHADGIEGAVATGGSGADGPIPQGAS